MRDVSRSLAPDYGLAVAPVGDQIAFWSDRGGSERVYLARGDGSGLHVVRGLAAPFGANQSSSGGALSFSADGRSLITSYARELKPSGFTTSIYQVDVPSARADPRPHVRWRRRHGVAGRTSRDLRRRRTRDGLRHGRRRPLPHPGHDPAVVEQRGARGQQPRRQAARDRLDEGRHQLGHADRAHARHSARLVARWPAARPRAGPAAVRRASGRSRACAAAVPGLGRRADHVHQRRPVHLHRGRRRRPGARAGRRWSPDRRARRGRSAPGLATGASPTRRCRFRRRSGTPCPC